jgi:hypothetical protein
MKQSLLTKLKKPFQSEDFRIAWPAYICGFITVLSAFLFPPAKLSRNTAIFVMINGLTWTTFIWLFIFRYHRFNGKPVGRTTLILLTLLTIVCIVGVAITVAAIFWVLLA